jgi:hypothetical protein
MSHYFFFQRPVITHQALTAEKFKESSPQGRKTDQGNLHDFYEYKTEHDLLFRKKIFFLT